MTDNEIIQKKIFLRIRKGGERLAHALLITGAEGIGKFELAAWLAKSLLCLSPQEEGEPCGRCTSCHLFATGNHPDYRLIQPEMEEVAPNTDGGEKKRGASQIKIQQIRELEDFFNVPSHISAARVCLIEPAEAMNAVTANALLKILEEPSPSLYFVIVSHRWRALLPTLRSRVQRIACAPPEEARARQWLAARDLDKIAEWLPFFGYAPVRLLAAHERGQLPLIERLLTALARHPDPLDFARELEALERDGLDAEQIIDVMQKWISDHAIHSAGGERRFLPAFLPSTPAPPQKLFALLGTYRQLVKLRPLSRHPLNPRLFLEDLCLRALAS